MQGRPNTIAAGLTCDIAVCCWLTSLCARFCLTNLWHNHNLQQAVNDSNGARTSRQPGNFRVTKVVRQVIRCKRQRSKGARPFRGQKILKPGHIGFGCTFSSKKLTTFFVAVVLKTQAANAADCFTVKIKQIKRSDMVTFLFSVRTITKAKQWANHCFPARSFDLARLDVALCPKKTSTFYFSNNSVKN